LLLSDEDGDTGKSLVAFSIRDDRSELLDRRLNSSRVAWQVTHCRGLSFCKDMHTTQQWTSWSGAATTGAFTHFGIDPDGLCVHIKLLSGRVYAVLREVGSDKHEGMVLEQDDRLYDRTISNFILADKVIL
jgi:hypothetical protein